MSTAGSERVIDDRPSSWTARDQMVAALSAGLGEAATWVEFDARASALCAWLIFAATNEQPDRAALWAQRADLHWRAAVARLRDSEGL
ncbi:MAG: hypothetical protein L6367_17835 [Cellulomonas sp.]|nr:hypothetical protein [Cellulomonas sp.]